jgi:hypothetical protein
LEETEASAREEADELVRQVDEARSEAEEARKEEENRFKDKKLTKRHTACGGMLFRGRLHVFL